jgi:nucleoside-diphosphate-sugar epimerase
VNTGARVACLPARLAKMGMKVAYKLRLSPLGPYQYKMISENFIFDTHKIKNKIQWKPTYTNEEMLYKAYQYYKSNLDEIRQRKNTSAHRSVADMGIIKVLKWMS